MDLPDPTIPTMLVVRRISSCFARESVLPAASIIPLFDSTSKQQSSGLILCISFADPRSSAILTDIGWRSGFGAECRGCAGAETSNLTVFSATEPCCLLTLYVYAPFVAYRVFALRGWVFISLIYAAALSGAGIDAGFLFRRQPASDSSI